MSEAAWNKAFTQGSRALQDRLKKVHASNPKFQSWMQKSGHATDTSVKQASKEVKPSARVKSLQTKSLQAYGATKGVKVGGEHGSDEMRDTIAPLTRDQHSKVQAAERAAKAAAAKAAPKVKKPLTQAQRMGAIAAAVRKGKTKHDVATVDPDDVDHDDLRDVHQSLHVSRGYNEEVELDEVTKQEAEKMLGGPVKTRTGSEPKGKLPLGFRRARNLARKAMKTVKESTTEVLEVNEMNYGKKLAKMIMAKQSQHPIAQNMGEAVKDAADVGEYDYEGDMAMSQLRSIMANSKRMHDMLEENTNLPEWVQSKITLAEDYISTAANYMESEMNEEVEQIDESDKVAKNIAKSMIAGKGKGSGLKVSTMNADESGAKEHKGKVHFVHHKDDDGEGDHIAVSHHKGKYVVSHTLSGEGEENPTKHFNNPDNAIAYGRKILGEEVEQIDELKKSTLASYVGKAAGRLAAASRLQKDFEKDGHTALAGEFEQSALKKKVGIQKAANKLAKEEAEGKVAVTPKEKDLAAHHGDKTRITYGDVIKARLKSAAAKKMGKK